MIAKAKTELDSKWKRWVVKPAFQLRFALSLFVASSLTALFVQRMIFDHIRDSIVEFYQTGDDPNLVLQFLDPSMVLMGWNFLFLFIFLAAASLLVGVYLSHKTALALEQNDTTQTENKKKDEEVLRPIDKAS